MGIFIVELRLNDWNVVNGLNKEKAGPTGQSGH
jgi:hypothetical protein